MTSRTFKRALLASTFIVLPLASLHAQETGSPPDSQGPQNSQLEELLVQGQYIPDEKRATSEISNVLDTQDFQVTGDADIAGALQRVTGLSLVGGKYVFVRGLGERYSSVLLDGAQLPSPEPLRRVVPLDIFPTAMLQGVLVQKTYSPQYPAEFGGGVLALRTRALPDEGFATISVSGAYDTESTFKDGLSYAGSNMDFLGFGGSMRKIPRFIAENYPIKASNTNLTPADIEKAGESFPNVWTLDHEPNWPNISIEGSAGGKMDMGAGRLGIIAAIRYSSEMDNRFGTRNRYTTSLAGPVINEFIDPAACDNFDGATGCGYYLTDWKIGLNGFFSAGYEFDDNNTLKYTMLLLRTTDRLGEISQGEFAASPGSLRNRSGIDWIEQQLVTNQISGEHYFDLGLGDDFQDTNLNWHVAYSQADREVKLRRDYTYDYDEVDQIYRIEGTVEGNRTSYGGLDDDNLDVGFDVDQAATFGGMEVDFKGGFTFVDKERDSAYRRFHFDFPTSGGALLELRKLIPEIIFGTANIDPNGITLREITEPTDFWSASMYNYQGFGQVDAQLTPVLRMAVGARYEKSKQIVDTVERTTGTPLRTILRGEYLLPAATLTYEFVENMQFRLAFSQTISRPDLRELSPAEFLDERRQVRRGQQFFLDSQGNVVGTPLKITQIDNYDARFEWYFGDGESITVGAFYKKFRNPIEWTYVARAEGFLREPRNAKGAELKGIEAELETYLPYLNKWSSKAWFSRKDFFLKLNGAVIDSNIELNPGVESNPNRSLQGQSDILANVQFGFDDTVTQERFALIFNFTGDRIDEVGLEGALDYVEKPPMTLDLTYARMFSAWGHEYEINFEANNLLNDNFLITQGNFVAESYKIGMTFKIGLKANF